jgi:hypothetical protein
MTTPKYEKRHWKEEFEDTKGVIRIRKLKKNRQQNKVKKTSDYPCCTLQHISEQTAENVLSRRIFEFQL